MSGEIPVSSPLVGQVVRTRWYSAKIFFFDVRLLDANPEDPAKAFLYRVGEMHETGILTSVKILELSEQIRPGDEVEIRFLLKDLDQSRGERSLDVFSLIIFRAWKDFNPELPFVESAPAPRPPEANASITSESRKPVIGEVICQLITFLCK